MPVHDSLRSRVAITGFPPYWTASRSDGTIWFTDPTFGITHEEQGYGGEQEAKDFVYRFDPATREIDAVIKKMERPNGIAYLALLNE